MLGGLVLALAIGALGAHGATVLTNADFAAGTLRITAPGEYR